MRKKRSRQSRKEEFRPSLFERGRRWFERGRRFFHEELWDLDLRPLPRLKSALIALVRIAVMIVRGFINDKCYMQAGTLTYLTLMSLIPILALMFSVSKGLGAQQLIMENIGLEKTTPVEMVEEAQAPAEVTPRDFAIIEDSRLAETPEQVQDIVITLFSMVERTRVGTLGVIGLVFLLWAVVRGMGKIENSFNTVWGVQTSRTLARRFSDYISIMVVVPILVLCATSLNAFLSSEQALSLVRNYFGELSGLYETALRGFIFGAIILAFTFLLMFMPNTKVRLIPALAGGLFTGGAWLGLQALYFMAQRGVSSYNAIYGTFAALPFFLVWLHTSWLIVLFGAELAFAAQNHRTYHLELRTAETAPATMAALGLLIMHEAGRRHLQGAGPWSVELLADQQEVPIRMVTSVVDNLRRHGLLRAVAGEPGGYVPGRDLSRITFADIELAFRGTVDPGVEKRLEATAPQLREVSRKIHQRENRELAQNNLRNLIENSASKDKQS